MLQAVNAKTRLVFIANPNNPTGTLLSQASLERFINALPDTCVCVLDEAYFEFVSSVESINSIDWLKKFPNLLITRTFSKAYGLAGLRMGYGLSSPEMADILNRVRQPFNNNTLALVAAEAALGDDEHLQQTLL
jgi:histidinol-phosphate aminotransferase